MTLFEKDIIFRDDGYDARPKPPVLVLRDLFSRPAIAFAEWWVSQWFRAVVSMVVVDKSVDRSLLYLYFVLVAAAYRVI